MDTPEGRGTVVEVNLLRQQVKVRMEDEPETVRAFANEDIAILRNGKAKKNDPPIPADLAPISGGGKRVRREKEENTTFLDPIKFRYRQEAVVEEPVEPAPAAQEQGENRKNRRNRSRNQPKTDQPAAEAPAPVPTSAEPQMTPEASGEKPKNGGHRRRYYHHRRKPKAGE